MMRAAAVFALLAAALGACADSAGNSVSTGVGGAVRSEYGRASR